MPRSLLTLVRLTPGRPALAAGLRAGAAATFPLLVGSMLPALVVSWLSLGAFQAALADRGGAYRSRARGMASVALCSSAACILGSLVGNSLWLVLPVGFVWLFACGLAQVGGAAAAGTGRAAAVAFVVAQARPVDALVDALGLGAAVFTGALLTMSLTLLLWPVRLYRPARLAVSTCFERLAVLARLLAAAPNFGGIAATREMYAQRSALREAVETARHILAATRGGRQAESERGEKLLRILENADQILGVFVAIDGWMEGAAPAEREQMGRVLSRVATSATAVAARLASSDKRMTLEAPALTREESGPAATGTTPSLALRAGSAPSFDPSGSASGSAGPAGVGRTLVARLARHLDAAVEAAEALYDDRPLGERPPTLEPQTARPALGELLRTALDPGSVTLRHAARLAIAASLANLIVALLGIDHGYWVTLTVIVVLQPWTNATFQRGVQRMAGTALGAGIAVLALGIVDSRLGFAAIIFVFCAASVALLPLNYGVFSIFLTPAFILLAELATGEFDLAWVRIFDTLIGGGTALLAALVLWPRWERQRFPDELATALRRSAAWLREQSRVGAEATAAERARRQVGIAVLNVEASLQRLLSEPGARTAQLEPLLVLTLYLRRIHATALAIATAGDPAVGRAAAAGAADFLEALAAGVAAGQPPEPAGELAALEALAEEGGAAVSRLARQLSIVQGAAVRAFAGGALRA